VANITVYNKNINKKEKNKDGNKGDNDMFDINK